MAGIKKEITLADRWSMFEEEHPYASIGVKVIGVSLLGATAIGVGVIVKGKMDAIAELATESANVVETIVDNVPEIAETVI